MKFLQNISFSKKTLIQSSLIVLSVIFFAGIAYGVSQKNSAPVYNNVVFITVGSGDKNSSVSDKEVAAFAFTETIIGWSLSPSFHKSTEFSFNGTKQERQNIIFKYTSPSEQESQKQFLRFKKTLNKKISEYNASFKTQFGILYEPLSTTQNTPQTWIKSIGGGILGFFLACFAIHRRKQQKNTK